MPDQFRIGPGSIAGTVRRWSPDMAQACVRSWTQPQYSVHEDCLLGPSCALGPGRARPARVMAAAVRVGLVSLGLLGPVVA